MTIFQGEQARLRDSRHAFTLGSTALEHTLHCDYLGLEKNQRIKRFGSGSLYAINYSPDLYGTFIVPFMRACGKMLICTPQMFAFQSLFHVANILRLHYICNSTSSISQHLSLINASFLTCMVTSAHNRASKVPLNLNGQHHHPPNSEHELAVGVRTVGLRPLWLILILLFTTEGKGGHRSWRYCNTRPMHGVDEASPASNSGSKKST